jgi:hypothetical protein
MLGFSPKSTQHLMQGMRDKRAGVRAMLKKIIRPALQSSANTLLTQIRF